jgi:hypothetical protein
MSGMMYALGPVVLVRYGFQRSGVARWSGIALALLIELLVYSIAGYRTAILTFVLTTGIYFILRWDHTIMSLLSVSSGVVVIVSSTALSLITGFDTLANLARRLLLAAGAGSAYYYDFFSKNEKTLMSSRSWVPIDYPYDYIPPNLIGRIYFNAPNSHINVNIWAEGYISFGLLGIILFSVGLALIFYVYDSLSYNIDIPTSSAILAGYLPVFAYTDMFTAMITHGMGLLFILVMLYPNRSS